VKEVTVQACRSPAACIGPFLVSTQGALVQSIRRVTHGDRNMCVWLVLIYDIVLLILWWQWWRWWWWWWVIELLRLRQCRLAESLL